MEIDKIVQEYNMKLCLRDSLPTCEAELKELEEDENVQKYIRLRAHYEKYKALEGKSDNDVLDDVIRTDNETIEENIYFCFGKNFTGHPKMNGGYFIEQRLGTIRLLHGIRVAKYVNLANPLDIIILPASETEAFEEACKTIDHQTDTPEQEYADIRREMYKQHMNESIKRLVKEPSHE